MLDRLPTPFSGKSSCEISFATMFVFQKFHVMHSHLIPRLLGAYEMHYAISIMFIPIYQICIYFTPHVYQPSPNLAHLSKSQFHLQWPIHTIIFHIIEQIILTHQAYALTYPFLHKSSHSCQLSYTPHMDVFGPIHTNPGLLLTVPKQNSGLSVGSPIIKCRFLLVEPNSMPISGLLLTKIQFII